VAGRAGAACTAVFPGRSARWRQAIFAQGVCPAALCASTTHETGWVAVARLTLAGVASVRGRLAAAKRDHVDFSFGAWYQMMFRQDKFCSPTRLPPGRKDPS
jgi:hypothetical protein